MCACYNGSTLSAWHVVYDSKHNSISDWDNATFSEMWPGWDHTIRLTGSKSKYNIDDIGMWFGDKHMLVG